MKIGTYNPKHMDRSAACKRVDHKHCVKLECPCECHKEEGRI